MTRLVDSNSGKFEAVAHVANRLDEAGLLGIRLDLVAQGVDATVHAALRHDQILAPNLVQDFCAGKRPPGVSREIFEQSKFLGRERNLGAVAKQLVRPGVELALAELKNLPWHPPTAAEAGVHPGQQNLDTEGFGDVIIRA